MMQQKPNILMIMTDQQRGDCLGCDGHPVLETPYLDQLAAGGTRFNHAYTAVASSVPARATLLTGMDQWHTGITAMGRNNPSIANNYQYTLPSELTKAGYHTQAIGKNHFEPYRALNGYHNTILDESGRLADSDYLRWFEQNKEGNYNYNDHAIGWNSWMGRPTHLPEHLHPTYWTAQESINWLSRRDPDKPFFLKMSFARPHSPYDPPQKYYDMYRDAQLPEPFIGEWSKMHDVVDGASNVGAWRSKRSKRELQRSRACYYGSITFIDHQIGRFLSHFQHHHADVAANTVIIFLSDHGDMIGDHHMWRKTYAYEGSSRVPMLLQLPKAWGETQEKVCSQTIELRDVMPTLLDAAGVEVPPTCQGKSMLPLVRGQETTWRDYIHGEHDWCYSPETGNQYVTDGNEKYIWFQYLGTEQFFDLKTDPGECHDLASKPEHADRVAIWRNRLIHELEQRNCALVKGGKLVTQSLEEEDIVVSPHRGNFGVKQAD